jgi:hypothetical protein
MPPLLLSPLIKYAAGALGAAAIVHWVVREVRRLNEELERGKPEPAMDHVRRAALPTLRRDPRTGQWRVM